MAQKQDKIKLHIGYDRKDKSEIYLPLNSLKRHFAAIGSSGSGKTVLVKCIMEEAVRAGVPLLLVDLQGDLASLAMMGNKEEVQKRGTPGAYWDDYKNKARVAIFTPASAKGISISMNPLKAPPKNLDREDMIQAIDSVATTVASILHYKTEMGKGADVKDYLFLLFQELWKKNKEINSFDQLSDFIKKDEDILDKTSQTMIDEKIKFELAKNVKSLTIGAESLIFNLGMPLDVKRMMSWTDDEKGKVPVNVLYLNTLRSQEDKINFIADTATQVYNYMLQNPSEDVQLIFVLDELAGLVPPIRAPASKRPIQLLLKQARKYGVSLLLATQNVSDVDYKSLGQVGSWALGRLMSKQDIDKVKDIIQSISPLETDEILSSISRQKTGQFMILAPDVFSSVRSISARWLVTDHKTLDDKAVKEQMDLSGIRDKFPEAKPKDDYVTPVGTDGSPSIGEYDLDATPDEIEVAIPIVSQASELTELMDNKPLVVSAEELSVQTGKSPKIMADQLDKLVEEKKLKVEEVNGVKVYWSPKHQMDPKNNILGPLFRFPLKFPQGPAKKMMTSRLPSTLGIRKKAEITKQLLVYVPLWRINGTVSEGEKRRFRKDVKPVRGFYFVNGNTGGILDLNEKEKQIKFPYMDIDPEELQTFEKSPNVEPIILDDLDNKFGNPVLNRQDALSVSEERLGLVLNKKVVPSIVWMPFWEFSLLDKDTDAKSKSWIDGHFGHLIAGTSPIDDEDTTEPLFNI